MTERVNDNNQSEKYILQINVWPGCILLLISRPHSLIIRLTGPSFTAHAVCDESIKQYIFIDIILIPR